MTLTIEEAAELVGVTPYAVRRWVDRGYLQPVRRGTRPLRFDEADVIQCRYERISRNRHDTLDTLWREIVATR